MKTAIGYIRVSSEEQADSGLGLEAQRQRVEAYCQMKVLQLQEIFEDAAVSGGKPLATRPAGARFLAEARRNKSVLVVAGFDYSARWSTPHKPSLTSTVSSVLRILARTG